jgi:nucleotide-binding universal stress UspA family protein
MVAPATPEPRIQAPATRSRRDDAPIVAGVDASTSGAEAVRTAIPIAHRLSAPVVFVYVRDGPSSILGEPYYQRRLDAETASAKRALGDALDAAERAGVTASGEVLDGPPAERLVEFAHLRGARLVVLGPRRRRRFRRSVSRRVARAADPPVLVATAPAGA